MSPLVFRPQSWRLSPTLAIPEPHIKRGQRRQELTRGFAVVDGPQSDLSVAIVARHVVVTSRGDLCLPRHFYAGVRNYKCSGFCLQLDCTRRSKVLPWKNHDANRSFRHIFSLGLTDLYYL